MAVYFNKFVNYLDTPGQRALVAGNAGLRPDMTFSELVDWLATTDGADRRTTDPAT